MDIESIIQEVPPESNTLDYKDKRAENKDVVKELVAFANADGGSVLLGVREENDAIEEIQNIPNGGEREEGIQNVIAESVEPRIRISTTRESVDGKTLLGFEVESDGLLHSIDIDGRPVFPYRQGTRIAYFHGFDINASLGEQYPARAIETVSADHESIADDHSDREKYDFSRANDWVGGVTRVGSLDDVQLDSAPVYSSPSNRVVTEVQERTIVVPGKIGLDPLGLDAVTYELDGRVAVEDEEDLKQLIERADDYLGINRHQGLSYAIYHDQRQIIGRHLSNFLEDNRRINRLVNSISPGSNAPSDPRPVGIITTPAMGGLFWIQVQWRDGTFRPTRGRCGLLLPNIPLDPTPIREFYETLAQAPNSFEQKSRIQHLSLNLSHELSDTEPVHLKTELDDVYTEIVAENPLYGQPDEFANAFDSEVPNRFSDAISSVNQLPYDVAGGWIQSDEHFIASDIDIAAVEAIFPTYIVDPLCFTSSE